MNEEFDEGYPDDWEAHYADMMSSGNNWDDDYMAQADGCESCGIGADELDIRRSGFLGRDYVIFCPYCGDAITGDTDGIPARVRGLVVDGMRLVKRLLRLRRRTSDDVANMGDIPF